MSKHPHKEIRKALAEAEAFRFRVRELRGHTWGRVECTCGDHVKVFSTGRHPELGAKRIRAFVLRHNAHMKRGSDGNL